jgi:hypothetical protein
MKPQIGQRWKFINPILHYSYIGEIIRAAPVIVKCVQVFYIEDSAVFVGSIFNTLTLTIDGPIFGSYGETWYYLEGQDK